MHTTSSEVAARVDLDGRGRRRELEGITDEIREHLEDAIAVTCAGRGLGPMEGECDAALLGEGAKELHGLLDGEDRSCG